MTSKIEELRLIILEFTLHNKKVEVIYILFSKLKDLLLFVKTRFNKSFIFQLIPFLLAKHDIVLTLMSLKLL